MEKHKVGIIGCGAIFVMHGAPLLSMENTEVKVVCDIEPSAAKIAGVLCNCRHVTDYRELLEMNDIDAVHVLTPHWLHAAMAIDAMRAGKHVLTEKPMAINMEDAVKMNLAASENKVTLGVISQNRYNAASVLIKNELTNGDLGRIISEKVILTWAKPKEYYSNSPWRGTWDKEGGALLIDQAIHVLDLARWFIGDEIECIEASIANRTHPEIETEDTAEGLIKYRNGVKALFYASNCYTINSPIFIEIHCENGLVQMEFDSATVSYNNGREIRVVNNPADSFQYGEFKGYIDQKFDSFLAGVAKKWGLDSAPVPAAWKRPSPYWGFSHVRQIKNFYRSLENGTPPDIDGEEAIKSHRMIMGIYESARSRKAVYF
jgi:UDP-N-acetyl-2-amino-2-deoxyglucuronate dehydrogenase